MKIKDISERKQLITLFIISLVSFFSNIWVREADIMEQRNFVTAREMVKNGEYLVTTLNGNLRFEKPPFPTWLTALVMKISGSHSDEWILRIPAALTGIVMVFLIYYLVKILTKDSTKAFLSGFVSATMFMLIKVSNENSWDIYTYVFAMGAIVLLLYGFEREKLRYYIGSGIMLAISIMSKGPVGIYGLVIPFIPAYILSFGGENFRKNWKKLILLVGIAIAISAIWPALMYLKYPDYFIKIMEKEENTWSNRHTKSFFFYLDYFVYTGIWIFFTIISIFKNGKEMKKERYSKFLIIWNGVVILLLSLIGMKKKRYGIPIYMVSAMNTGVLCAYYKDTVWEKLKKYEKILLYIQSGFITIVSIGIMVLFTYETFYKKNLSPLYTIFTIVVYCGVVYKVIKIFKDKKTDIGKFIVILSGFFMILVNLTASWFIDIKYVDKQVKGEFVNSKILQKNPPKLDIYSTDYSVDEVWDVGKEIKDLNLKNRNTLPDRFIILGQVPFDLRNNYNIYKNRIYSENDGDILRLYYLNRKENPYESASHWYEPKKFVPVEQNE